MMDEVKGTALEELNSRGDEAGWYREFLELRLEGWDWRKAAYIAWAASPTVGRWPETQFGLATQVLGLRSDRVIRKWRDKDPAIDERVEKLQAEPLLRHRRDVIDTLIKVATTDDHRASPDRKLFFQLTGELKTQKAVEISGPEGGPVEVKDVDVGRLSDEELAELAKLAERIRQDPA